MGVLERLTTLGARVGRLAPRHRDQINWVRPRLDMPDSTESKNTQQTRPYTSSPLLAVAECPRCGLLNGRYSCCVQGGSWDKQCGGAGNTAFKYTWGQGFKACDHLTTTTAMPGTTNCCTLVSMSTIPSYAKLPIFHHMHVSLTQPLFLSSSQHVPNAFLAVMECLLVAGRARPGRVHARRAWTTRITSTAGRRPYACAKMRLG